jgi:CheY-like chemotaxis protein
VVLPIATAPSEAPGARAPRGASPVVPRSRVLVVDDERLVAASLRRALAADHDVTVCSSGRIALRLVERGERFDAVLTDLVMPDTTGLELHRQLVALAPDLDGRVLFMTAGAFTEEARRATEIAPEACLEKPVRLDVLRAALARVIAAPR